MSSTDFDTAELDKAELSLQFHEEQLKPVALQLPGPHFPLAPDREGATSYWEERVDGVPPILTIDDDQVEELLRDRWAQEPQLAELVPALLKLAKQLEPDEEVEEDLDPYIYRMF